MKPVKLTTPGPRVPRNKVAIACDANRTFGVSLRRADAIVKGLKKVHDMDVKLAEPGARLVELVFNSSEDKDTAVEFIYARYEHEFDDDHWKSY